MNRGMFLGICLAALLCRSAMAAENTDYQRQIPVTLTEAWATAAGLRPEMLIAGEKEKLADSKLRAARGNFLPTLDLTATTTYVKNYDTYTGIEISAKVANQDVAVSLDKSVPAYQLSDELSLVYNLFAGGRDGALAREAMKNRESAHLETASIGRSLQLEVANAYWALRKAQIKCGIAKRERDLVRQELLIAKKELEVVRKSAIDYQATLLKDKEKEVALHDADSQCRRAFLHYVHVLGLPAQGNQQEAEKVPVLADDPESAMDRLPNNEQHPDLQRLTSEIAAAEERQEAARAENAPKVDLFAKHSLIGRDSGSFSEATDDLRSEASMVGIKVSLNLFNGFRSEERITQAAVDLRIKKLQFLQKKHELQDAEDEKQAAMATAEEHLNLARQRLQLEEDRENVAKTQLQEGRISPFDSRRNHVSTENAADEVTLAAVDLVLAKIALSLLVLPQERKESP